MLGAFFVQCAGLLDDFVEGFVSATGLFAEDLNEVAIGWRIYLRNREDKNGNDDDESPEVISVHGGR
jgi:hypothetical protein